MEYINLRQQELDNNKNLFNEGYESKIYAYSYENKEILIKKYYDLDQVNIEKIKLLTELKTNILIRPEKLVKINDDVVGFSMKYLKNFYPICVMKDIMSDEEKYDLLIILKEEIINLRNQNCIYGDLNVKNVITDGKKVHLCDPVNVKINNYKFDQISSTMKHYYDLKDTFTGIDCYMLNLLTIYLFNNIDYNEILERIETTLSLMFNNKEYINYIGINDSQECMNICYDMISNKPTDNFLIDYITLEKEKIM